MESRKSYFCTGAVTKQVRQMIIEHMHGEIRLINDQPEINLLMFPRGEGWFVDDNDTESWLSRGEAEVILHRPDGLDVTNHWIETREEANERYWKEQKEADQRRYEASLKRWLLAHPGKTQAEYDAYLDLMRKIEDDIPY